MNVRVIITILILSAALYLGLLYALYARVLGCTAKQKKLPIRLPKAEGYIPYHEQMKALVAEMEQQPFETVETRSRDGLLLKARYLHVRDGKLSATLTLGSKSYLALYPGSALEAATADESGHIPYAEDADGAYAFTIPVEALDAPVPCAAFSKNKQLWYDRTLLFRADSLPVDAFRAGFFTTAESLGLADGDYSVEVTLGGGSGRASVQSPCRLRVENGVCTAEIVWGSANYDYMIVDGEKLPAELRDGHSVCVIPVAAFDRALGVIADTTAMSQPHEIEYTLRFNSATVKAAP